jgi:hypothetical protein
VSPAETPAESIAAWFFAAVLLGLFMLALAVLA